MSASCLGNVTGVTAGEVKAKSREAALEKAKSRDKALKKRLEHVPVL